MASKITVEATVAASIDMVWESWTAPQHIQKWNNASEDWHTPKATNDLRTGGNFLTRMEAKDGSFGFDFEGTYTEVIKHEFIAYELGDGRKVSITFENYGASTKVVETFDPENENPIDMQKDGWQAILNNFKTYTENNL